MGGGVETRSNFYVTAKCTGWRAVCQGTRDKKTTGPRGGLLPAIRCLLRRAPRPGRVRRTLVAGLVGHLQAQARAEEQTCKSRVSKSYPGRSRSEPRPPQALWVGRLTRPSHRLGQAFHRVGMHAVLRDVQSSQFLFSTDSQNAGGFHRQEQCGHRHQRPATD